jgi:hypothetical protein
MGLELVRSRKPTHHDMAFMNLRLSANKRLRSMLSAASLLLIVSPASAGVIMTATVSSVTHHEGGLVSVGFDSTTNVLMPDACHTSGSKTMAFSVATDQGKALLSTVTAALLSGKRLDWVSGTTGNNCTTVTKVIFNGFSLTTLTNAYETLAQLQVMD